MRRRPPNADVTRGVPRTMRIRTPEDLMLYGVITGVYRLKEEQRESAVAGSFDPNDFARYFQRAARGEVA
jgi:hypothetical protein